MAWRSNITKKTKPRRDTRTAVNGTLRILWEDSAGKERISQAQIVNVSASGAQLRLDEKIPVRSYVTCNDERLGIRGRASVRYCNFAKGKYEIGLEFTNDNGWRGVGDRSIS
jgi:PilZ domain